MPSPTTTTKAPPRRALGRTLRQCPICGSAELGYEFIVDGCPVCLCEHCGLLFLNPQPADVDTRPGDRGAPMPASVYDLHASNAASRLDQLIAYAGATVQRLLMIANDAFLTDEARRRRLDVVSLTSAEAQGDALKSMPPRLKCMCWQSA